VRSRPSLPGLAVFESLGSQSGRRNTEDSNMGTFEGYIAYPKKPWERRMENQG